MRQEGGRLSEGGTPPALGASHVDRVAPAITAPLSELDASRLVGMPEQTYSSYMQDKTGGTILE